MDHRTAFHKQPQFRSCRKEASLYRFGSEVKRFTLACAVLASERSVVVVSRYKLSDAEVTDGYHYQTAVVVVVVVVNGVRASVAHVIIRNGIPPPRRHHRWPIVKHLFCFAMPLTFDYQKTREGGRLLNRLHDLWLLSLSLCLFA